MTAAARRHHREGREAGRADRRRVGRRCSDCPPARRWRCTTSSSSAADPPDWPPRCTAPPRASRPCSSRRPPPAGRRAAVRGSRTTWASRTASRARELTTTARRQAERFGAEVITTPRGRQVKAGGVGAAHSIQLNDGTHDRRARGDPRHRRRLPTAADHRLLGRPRRPGAQLHRPRRLLRRLGLGHRRVRGEDVYIVGGANSAGQAAMFMSQTAKSVTMLVRGPSLEAWMSQYLIDQIVQNPEHHRPDLHGGRRHRRRGRTSQESGPARQADRRDRGGDVRPDVLLHRRDAAHRMARGAGIARDDRGFILSGPDVTKVSGWIARPPAASSGNKRAGCFVAGDVRSESAKRVAAAVGEGSMAVMLVHRYLAET